MGTSERAADAGLLHRNRRVRLRRGDGAVRPARLGWLLAWVATLAFAATPEQAEQLLIHTPKPALEMAQQQLASLPPDHADRPRWHAIASEAGYALALPEVAAGEAEQGLASPLLSAELQQRLSIARAQGLDISGRAEHSIELLMTVVATLEQGEFDPQFLVDALTARASAYYSISNYRAALADLLRVYPIAPEQGPRTIRADVATALGNVYAAIEDYPHAEQFYLEAIEHALQQQSWVRASIAEYSLAAVYRRARQWEKAADYFERARQHSAAADDVQGVAYAEFGLAQVALELRDLDRSERMYRQSLPVFEAAGDLLPQANVYHGLARIAFERGAFRDAVVHSGEALRLMEQVVDLDFNHKLLALRADAQFALGDYRAAFDSLRRSAEIKQAWLEARNNESLSEMRVRFDTERQRQQNILLLKENQLNAAKLAEQTQTTRLYIVSMVALSLLLGFLVLLAVRSKQVRRRLAVQALTDELTGVANRRKVMATLAAEFERARRYRTTLSIAMLDLDHFKQVNDRFGHAAGDQVLRAFASMAAGSLRKTDCFGRIGGEEFLAILPHTDGSVAVQVMERMRRATGALVCPRLEGSFQPSVSIGVAVLDDLDSDIDVLLKRADDAVYRAKQGGRNRVVAAEEAGSTVL